MSLFTSASRLGGYSSNILRYPEDIMLLSRRANALEVFLSKVLSGSSEVSLKTNP